MNAVSISKSARVIHPPFRIAPELEHGRGLVCLSVSSGCVLRGVGTDPPLFHVTTEKPRRWCSVSRGSNSSGRTNSFRGGAISTCARVAALADMARRLITRRTRARLNNP